MLRISPTAENQLQPPQPQRRRLSSQPLKLTRKCLSKAFQCDTNPDMAKYQPSWGLPGPEVPASPRTMRTLRKIQSHQVLTTSNALIAQTQSSRPGSRAADPGSTISTANNNVRATVHRRARSNSDAATREAALAPVPTQRRPARKTGSGIGLKRSLLENLIRDGPQNGRTQEALQELKYLVLSTRVDADGDGMVCTFGCLVEVSMAILIFFWFLVTLSDLPLAHSSSCPSVPD